MGKFIDLKGKVFEKLTVLELAEPIIYKNGRKTTAWLCQCECGNQKIISSKSLTSKTTKSCGCLQKEKTSKIGISKRIDLTGRKFEKLTVICANGKDNWGQLLWKCECECGNEITTCGGNLRRGLTKSCGCSGHFVKKYNTYDLTGEYGIGYTTKGGEFYFDLEDYDKIKKHGWFISQGYVVTNIGDKKFSMHRWLINCDDDLQVDHINRIRHDNRKMNLRMATNQQNCWNTGKRSTNTSGHKGVYWNKKLGKWTAQIVISGHNIHLGYFTDKLKAAKVRQEASEKYYKEFNGTTTLSQ